MRRLVPLLFAALLIASPRSRVSAQTTGDDRFVGTWVGAVQTPTMKLRLALTVDRANGALTGYMTSIDQGNAKMPGTLTVHGDSIAIAMPAIGGRFAGVLANDSIIGTFSQGMALSLHMARGALPTITHSQDPKPPFPYATEEVSFESVPGVRLAGTIIRPEGAGPFPAVVFATGSGPQDRNEELLGHKPFLVIADYLARHGIASLRVDDRGVAKSTGSFASATSADFANDVEAAVKFLRAQRGIAPNHVGIIGHSEGGLIAPIVAARSKDVAFIVLLAGPGLPGDSILLMQQDLIGRATGLPDVVMERAAAANTKLYEVIKSSRDSAEAAARVDSLNARMVATLPEAERPLGAAQLAQAKKELLTPWMMYFIKYDPRPTLRQVRVPVLALNGSLDLQVPPKEDLAAIDAALKAAGNKDYRIVELPGLNHLFQPAKTGAPTEYSSIDITVSPDALAQIAEWISSHARK